MDDAQVVPPRSPAPGAVPAQPGAGPASRVFPGRLDAARDVRRWVRDQAPPGTDPGDSELLATEFFANAVLHTLSGGPGGTVTVIVTADGALHVHDRGTAGPCPALDGWPRGREGFGRGLVLAAALGTGLAHSPVTACPAAAPGEPGGCCTTWRPAVQAQAPSGAPAQETGQTAAAAAA